MEIRINKLRMHNFKGIRSAEYDFAGGNARIEGPNGSGKSTVFDAFTWLLFGKDHRGQTTDTFELKTIDPATGRPYPRLDHWVEAELSVDGRRTTLRRGWAENWVKPSGQLEEVFKGNTGTFYVDGINVGTKKAYDDVIAGWMNEDSFKLLTNPFYFIDDAFTPWKNRRKALMDLVKDSPERSRVSEAFKDVVKEIAGRDVDAYRKQLALEKSANKRDLASVLARIDGMREALPAEVDESAVRAQLAEAERELEKSLADLNAEKERIDRSISSADAADEERKAENARIWGEISAVQLWMSDRITEARNAARTKINALAEDARKAGFALHDAEEHLEYHRKERDKLEQSLKDAELERGKAAADLNALGEKYQAEKKRFFDYKPSTRCSLCGQEIPAASIEESIRKARAEFEAERKEATDFIISAAESTKAAVVNLDEAIRSRKERLEAEEAEVLKWKDEVSKCLAEVNRLRAIPVEDPDEAEEKARKTEEFREKIMQEHDLRVKAMNTASRPDDLEAMIRERAEVEKKLAQARDENARRLEPIKAQLTVNCVRREQEALIAEKEQEARLFADAVANCERLEARVAEYVKADVESVNAAIAGLFRVARWKMYDQTLDGNYVETCEVTSPEGVPYRSMNDAMKILCGIDCIRVFSERYGLQAPIFVDNAECILRSAFDTEAQVVRLVVSDCVNICLVRE